MLRIVEHGDRKIAILQLIGDPLGEEDAVMLRKKIHEIGQEQIRHVIIDMSNVRHINSAGLGGLIAAMFTVLKAKGDLRVAAVGKNVEKIFKMTHLDQVFVTDDSVEAALKNYRV